MFHNFVWFSPSFPCPIKLLPASEGSDKIPLGVGYLHVPAKNQSGFLPIKAFYHPDIRTTVIDERDFNRAAGVNTNEYTGETISKDYDSNTFTYHSHHRETGAKDVVIHGALILGKAYTQPLIPPQVPPSQLDATPVNNIHTHAHDDNNLADDCQKATLLNIFLHQVDHYHNLRKDLETTPSTYYSLPFHEYIHRNTPISTIKTSTERMLWHQRLGHPSDHYLYNAHKFVKGVPHFRHETPVLDTCPVCIQSKQKKEPPGPNSTRTATAPYQGLSIDFAFAGCTSKNQSTRAEDYIGLHGETAYILIVDHFSRRYHGETRVSKASPIAWIRNFLQQHAPPCDGKYVFLDQGGELYRNPKIRSLFTTYGYETRPTGAGASHQNGPVERAHLNIANGVRALLLGSNLPAKFWPYAFHHYIRVKNAIPSRDQHQSPLTLAVGKIDDFTAFRTFGCRVWVKPTTRRPAKFKTNSRKGIFLGFIPNTTKNILWYNPETSRVMIAKHARFDEGMNDLPFDSIPPNVQLLQRVQAGAPFPAELNETSIPTLDFSVNPFSRTFTKKLLKRCNHPLFGLTISTDALNDRAYVSNVTRNSSASKMFSTHKAATNKIRGAYIVQINNHNVFTKNDAVRLLQQTRDRNASVDIVFAPERAMDAKHLRQAISEHNIFQPDAPDDEHLPAFTIADIRSIASLRQPDIDVSPDAIPLELIQTHITAIQSDAITPAEHALGTFTRKKLKTLSTWGEWLKGEHEQLDHFHKLGMYGPPMPRPARAVVLRPHWTYHIKRDGTRRSRNCCDGSPRSAPALHTLASTYSSCVEQPVQRMFFALAAHLGYRVYGADAQDAYAHSPPPDQPTYIAIDDQYADWYKARHGTNIDRSMVLPVQHALQGHPEAGRLWETHINHILRCPELHFRHTTHDKTIYTTIFRRVQVLLLRQVDDFALACTTENIAKDIYTIIGSKLQLPGEDTPPIKYLGLIHEFNGIDIDQDDQYIAISCSHYIERVLKTHGWETPAHNESDSDHQASPLPLDATTQLYSSTGPADGTDEHGTLETAFGFNYRSLLGELMYAYVTCRPDIGYAVTTLSKFSPCPSAQHYTYLKNVARYLRRTRAWKIYYTKPRKDDTLPHTTFTPLPEDASLPTFPRPTSPGFLCGYVDAAHANDLRNRRSTTGYAFTLNNGVIAYRSKTQTVTATSSTEAEFIAAVSAAKTAKYLRSILGQLGFPQSAPTPLYEDNMSTIKIINAQIPTERSRHIDIASFAIQEWKQNGDIVLEYIPGIINPADDMTKPLGWVLHSRHARRLMGHYNPSPLGPL
ncbi:MAG: hypothetical protein LW863_11705 [Flammeovirgaceae bacterium]|nr:hypothetical protein [Flammeovirgaceae bacterium]